MEQLVKTDVAASTLLAQISQSELVANLLARRFNEIQAPTSVQDAVERGIPLVMVQKATGEESLLQAIEFEILTIAGYLNLNAALTIKPGQSQIAAQVIFENFRTESLEDIKLAFKRGASGLYGEIFRLDGAVLVRWIQCYLEEKYQVVERIHNERKAVQKADDSQVDYRAHIERIQRQKEEFEQAKKEAIEARRKEARMRIEQLDNPRQIFVCDGIEVTAVSEHYAKVAYKEMFKRYPDSVKLKEAGPMLAPKPEQDIQ